MVEYQKGSTRQSVVYEGSQLKDIARPVGKIGLEDEEQTGSVQAVQLAVLRAQDVLEAQA